jgi:hypothetical protein
MSVHRMTVTLKAAQDTPLMKCQLTRLYQKLSLGQLMPIASPILGLVQILHDSLRALGLTLVATVQATQEKTGLRTSHHWMRVIVPMTQMWMLKPST